MKTVLLFIFPAIIFAGNIEMSLSHHSGNASYIVESRDETLKSQLDFPFELNTIDLEYHYRIGSFALGFSSSLMLNSDVKIGKDYDWRNSELTVFSTSKNHIDRYFDVGLMVSRDVANDLAIFSQVHYKTLDIDWTDTYQEDYVKNKNEFIIEKSLEYQQTFYEYTLGMNYQVTFLKGFTFEFKPSVLYTMAELTDKHILRGFYTVQNIQTFGYDIMLKGSYQINSHSKINLLFNNKKFSDNNIDMNYYNQLDKKYLTLPSSYDYESSTISIGYSFSF